MIHARSSAARPTSLTRIRRSIPRRPVSLRSAKMRCACLPSAVLPRWMACSDANRFFNELTDFLWYFHCLSHRVHWCCTGVTTYTVQRTSIQSSNLLLNKPIQWFFISAAVSCRNKDSKVDHETFNLFIGKINSVSITFRTVNRNSFTSGKRLVYQNQDLI